MGPFALCCLREIEKERKSGGSCKEKPQMEKTREPSDKVCETALWLLLFFCNDDFERETLYRRCWSDCTFLTHFAPLKVQSFLFSIISSHWFHFLTAAAACSRSQAEASSIHLEASPSGVQDYKMCREQFPPASFIPSPSVFSIYLPMSSNPRKKKTSRRRSESGKCSVEPCPSSSREPCTYQV